MQLSPGRVRAMFPVLLALAACRAGERATTASWSEVRDSSGITIVENRVPVGDPLRWTVGGRPSLSIGSVDGLEGGGLFKVVGASRMADGRILIANAGTSEVKVFDPDGTYLEAWGGAGEGPGEFSSLLGVAPWLGDSVVAWEASGERVTVFDAEGHPGRTLAPRVGENQEPAPPVSVSADGQLLVATLLQLTPANIAVGLVSMPRRYALLGSDGGTVADLGGFPAPDLYVPKSLFVIPHPFGRRTLATTWGVQAVIGVTTTFAARVFDSEGRLTRIIRLDRQPAGVTQKDIDHWTAAWVADADESQQAARRAVAAELPTVPAFPAYSALKDDPLGYLWIQDYQMADGDRVVWSVFDPEGRILGNVETPRGRTVLEIGRDYILTLRTDELGVESVESWPLRRPSMGTTS